ncbi:MAG: hypothetical protein LC803_11005 [Acidobacteria bacterium]|nr:hypothetical protein [Acidobacteriota bacterium]
MSTLEKEEANTTDELVKGERHFYDEHPRAALEPEHLGCCVTIESDSGGYFLGDTGTQVLSDTLQALPESLFYLARVRHLAVDTMSG